MLTIVTGLAVAINFAGPKTGGCINPAIGVGLNTMSMIFYDFPDFAKNTWFVLVFPLLGGLLAGVTYKHRHMVCCDRKCEACEEGREDCEDEHVEERVTEMKD